MSSANTAPTNSFNMASCTTRTVDVPETRVAQVVFGPGSAHMKQIEDEFGVSIQQRQDKIMFMGLADNAEKAKRVFKSLVTSVQEKRAIDTQYVAGVIDHIRNEKLERAASPVAPVVVVSGVKTIIPRNEAQAAYRDKLAANDMVFGTGPAGTGKTYFAAAFGAAMLKTGQVERLILSRPAVEAGERLGFLPGDMKEKVDPYMRPIYDALHDIFPAEDVSKRIASGEIEIAPLAFMRGRTLSHAFALLDEAQNTTEAQMKMFLTRMGEGTKMVITGDATQVDLPSGTKSGLSQALDVLRGVKGIGIQEFVASDVVRHPLVGRIVERYEDFENASSKVAARQSGPKPSNG